MRSIALQGNQFRDFTYTT